MLGNRPGFQAGEPIAMKTKNAAPKRLSLAASALICCALNLPAQTAPTITTQPTNQMLLAGSNATFTVAVSGTGPFSYQWQFDGTNPPSTDIIITTVAGGGSSGLGDGGAATNAGLIRPNGVAFDASGNLYVADTGNSRVRRVDTNGVITTVAGTNSAGYSGDRGAAIKASLNWPTGVVFDSFGNLYIADDDNNCIRKVDTNGIITTVAGRNSAGYSGDGSAATIASLHNPRGVALDASGNLYIADQNNNRIRKVDTNGVITTVAGNGTTGYSGDGGAATNAELYGPVGVASDVLGNLYIADQNNCSVRRVGANSIITTVAGTNSRGYSGDGGAATNAKLTNPSGVVLDASGNLYIADTGNNRVRRVDTNGVITTVAGANSAGFSGDGGAAAKAILNSPLGVALDVVGNLFIADTFNQRVREVHYACYPTLALTNVSASEAGSYTVVVTSPYGSVTSAVATLTVAALPSIVVQPASQVVLAGSNTTLSVTAAGSLPLYYLWYDNATNLVQYGTNAPLSWSNPNAGNAGSYIVVVTNAWGSVTSQIAVLTVVAPPLVTTQPATQGVSAGTNVSLSVTVAGSGPFTYQWQFNGTNLPNNIISTVAGNGSPSYAGDGHAATKASLYHPFGVALDAAGNLYIADTGNNRIRKVDTNGIIITVAGNNNRGYSGDHVAATSASLYSPEAVALDAAANLYISDTDNQLIRRVSTNGIITTVAGDGAIGYYGDGSAATASSLNYPLGIALDAAANLYIADVHDSRIRKVGTNGIIMTIAGNGVAAYSGEGGAATKASLNYPFGVGLDAAGNLYIADAYNHRIRKVGTNGIITTIAGNGVGAYSGDGGAATNASVRYPYGVALDFLGNLYIVDSDNNRIRMVDTDGLITTVAGNGTAGYSGDGGEATNASLFNPVGVALDASGNLYIADTVNNRTRKVLLYAGHRTFEIINVRESDAGTYTVVVTNPTGSVTSAVATLTVQAPPVIAVQPASQAVAAGSIPVFSVSVVGSVPFGYLWYFAGTNLVQSGTNSTLTLPGVFTNNSGHYTVVVTNAYGCVTSLVATLTVGFPPSVTTSMGDSTVLAGTNVIFSVTAGGTGPFSYQWQLNGTNLPNNLITTVAGGGSDGDGGAATNANLAPSCVVLDSAANIYISDSYYQSVRKVDTNGIITTIAGSGIGGFTGDGGPATNARLDSPNGMAFDAAGNLYIADTSNQRVRMVATNGIITTVAGNGKAGFSGNGGAATSASLYDPVGVVLDALGNLYIADFENNQIRMVDTNGIITTVAGNGTMAYSGDGGAATNASLNLPDNMTLDATGILYIADYQNQRIRKVDANGIITTVAGIGSQGPVYQGSYSGDGGEATNAGLYYPADAIFDSTGNLYIADQENNRIRKVDTNGIITTFAGGGAGGDGGAATNANLSGPNSVALDGLGNVYIADVGHSRVRKVDSNGIISTIAGNGGGGHAGDGGAATKASLNDPLGVALDAFGNLFIADYGNSRIRKVDTTGVISTVANNGSVISPSGVVTDAADNVYIAAYRQNSILKEDTNGIITTVAGGNFFGAFAGDGGAATNASLYFPSSVALDVAGNLFIADQYNQRIRKVGTSGIITTVVGGGNSGYLGDGGLATCASLRYPAGVALDAAGNLYIADTYNCRVRKVDSNGIITTVAGGTYGYSGDGGAATNAGLYPYGVAFDAAGNLYISDNYNFRIRKVDTNGIITTVAGNGTYGYSGDGGAATNAGLCPYGVALDAVGNLYIADSANQRIREVYLAGYPTLSLINVGASSVGNYTAVVTSPYGSVTSAVAALTVTIPNTPPQIVAADACFGFGTNQFGFNLSGAFGQTIVVDGSTNLVDWTPLCTNTVGGGNPVYFCDPASTNSPWRFYRARLQ